MKNIIIASVVILLLSSCVTRRACNRKFPPSVNTETIIETEVELRDTVIYVYLPGDTITSAGDTVYIHTETGLAESDRSELSTIYSFSSAQVINGLLQHELIQKDTVIERVIEDAIQKHSTHKETLKEVVRYENRLAWWQTGLIVSGIVLWIIVGALVWVWFN